MVNRTKFRSATVLAESQKQPNGQPNMMTKVKLRSGRSGRLGKAALCIAALASLSSVASAQTLGSNDAKPAQQSHAEPAMPKSAACVVNKAVLCKDGACAPTSKVGDTPLPLKLTLDFRNRVILSVDKDGYPVATPISVFAGDDKKLILQGIEGGVGWTVHGSASDLSMTFSLAWHHTILSGFGTCEIDED
jgi:hypothetical protein